MGPVVLVTLGVLFLLSEFQVVGFGHTWPILLIAIGLVKVLCSGASAEGHVSPYYQQPPPAASGPAGPPPIDSGHNPQQVDHV